MENWKEQLKAFQISRQTEKYEEARQVILDAYEQNKDRLLSLDYPRDDLEMGKLMRRKIFDWVEKNKNGNKKFSQRFIAKLESQIFSVRIKEKQVIIFYRVARYKPQFFGSYYSLGILEAEVINYVSTRRGLLYMKTAPDVPLVKVFSSHLFERLEKRADNVGKGRFETLRKFIMRRDNIDDVDIVIVNEQTQEMQLWMPNEFGKGVEGLILGHMLKTNNGIKLMVLSTYIAPELMKYEQKALLKEYLSNSENLPKHIKLFVWSNGRHERPKGDEYLSIIKETKEDKIKN